MLYHNMLVSPRLGGGEKLALTIHKYIDSVHPGQARLVIPAGGDTAALAVAEALPCVTYSLDDLTAPQRLRSLLANAALTWQLRGSARGLLHVHSPFVYGALRPMLALSRIKTILHLHLDYSVEQLQWAFKRPPDMVMMCANFMRERVETVLSGQAQRSRVVAVVNAVDTQRFVPGDRARVKQELGLEEGRPLLLMAANLAPHKGQMTAIRAMAQLYRLGQRPLLWLVGEEREAGGQYTAQLRAQIAELGLESSVQLLGFRTDMPRLLQAADCLLLPSTSEGLPLSILEAQASRAVVLAAPTAGVPEVVEHERTGFLIGADDADGYAQTLDMLLRYPAQAEAIRDAALRRVQADFTMSSYCGKVRQEYEALLAA